MSPSLRCTLAGRSSRGLFLRCEPGWIVFLSSEPYPGPLTINIPGLPAENVLGVVGDYIQIDEPGIRFSGGLVVELNQAVEWSPPAAGQPTPGIGARLKETARLALAEKGVSGFSRFLARLLALDQPARLAAGSQLVESRLQQALEAAHAGDAGRLGETLLPVLGWGTGLTPSGDDLILGLLLVLARYPGLAPETLPVSSLGSRLARAASARTTTLSANLIECAALGQADARLINGLSGVVEGIHPPEECAKAFCDWGNSSGLDALAGMALIIGQASLERGRPEKKEN